MCVCVCVCVLSGQLLPIYYPRSKLEVVDCFFVVVVDVLGGFFLRLLPASSCIVVVAVCDGGLCFFSYESGVSC